MTISPTYPGVYIQELPSGVHTITGASTSNTAFLDYFSSGPVNVPTQITSFAQFQTVFGGLSEHSEASYAILQYFRNGGQVAYVQRVLNTDDSGGTKAAQTAYKDLPTEAYGGGGTLNVFAANPGMWGNSVQVAVAYPPKTQDPTESHFNLYVRVWKNNALLNSETYLNLTMDKSSANYVVSVVNNASTLISVVDEAMARPAETGYSSMTAPTGFDSLSHGSTGTVPVNDPAKWATLISDQLQPGAVLEQVPFEILCLPITCLFDPDYTPGGETDPTQATEVLTQGQLFCQAQRAFLIIDPPPSSIVSNTTDIVDWVNATTIAGNNAQKYSAVYYPRLTIPDPNQQLRPRQVGASGAIAGLFARTDMNRGVWKAPAGTDASLVGAQIVTVLTDTDSGNLNPLGIDALRNFPVYGNVVWGARTLAGADQLQSDYKYVPVRRLTSYIESSLYEGTQWAVFEPNDETLWSSLRVAVNTFMAGLSQQGAFYSYFVQCDKTTTTPTDIQNGICNVIVGFAPVKPAEFIVLQIQQLAGQAAS